VRFQWNILYNERVSRTPLGFRDEARDAASNIVLKRSLVRSVNASIVAQLLFHRASRNSSTMKRLIAPFCDKCWKKITKLAGSTGKYPETTQQRS